MDVLVEMLHLSKHFFPFALVSFSLEQTFSSVRWVMYFCGTWMFTGQDNSAIRRKEISQMEIFFTGNAYVRLLFTSSKAAEDERVGVCAILNTVSCGFVFLISLINSISENRALLVPV